MMNKLLASGIAFVTGGARGLGSTVALSFAKAGVKGVVLVDVLDDATLAAAAKDVQSYGATCLAIQADVTKEKEVENAISQTVAKFGRIDYAANFAGTGGRGSPVTDMSLDNFQNVMNVNTTGIFLCNKYQLRQMMQQSSIEVGEGREPQRGSIVNCASVNSIQAIAGSVAYTASKHAVVGISKTAALEARAHGVRVNAVSPGFFYTELIHNALNRRGGEEGMARWESMEARQGRRAALEDLGDAVTLLSAPGMTFVNGHNLVVDNGFVINEGA